MVEKLSVDIPQFCSLSTGSSVTAEIEIKRSQFICYLQRVENEQDARAFIEEIRRLHPTARHHCTAFRLGGGSGDVQERSSDDREPSGTAGKPMLAALRGADLVNVCAVVVRYFGGILLGTGGLVRAYTDAVNKGITAARQSKRLAVCRLVDLWSVQAPIIDVGRWEADLRGRGLEVVDVFYGEGLLPVDAVDTARSGESAQTSSAIADDVEAARHPDPMASVIVVAVMKTADAAVFCEHTSALSAGSQKPYRTGRMMYESQLM